MPVASQSVTSRLEHASTSAGKAEITVRVSHNTVFCVNPQMFTCIIAKMISSQHLTLVAHTGWTIQTKEVDQVQWPGQIRGANVIKSLLFLRVCHFWQIGHNDMCQLTCLFFFDMRHTVCLRMQLL